MNSLTWIKGLYYSARRYLRDKAGNFIERITNRKALANSHLIGRQWCIDSIEQEERSDQLEYELELAKDRIAALKKKLKATPKKAKKRG